jgi:hypothetical protein
VCDHVHVGAVTSSLAAPSSSLTLAVAVRDIELRCRGTWAYKDGILSGHGTLVAAVGDGAISANLALLHASAATAGDAAADNDNDDATANSPSSPPHDGVGSVAPPPVAASLAYCKPALDITSMEFKGGLSGGLFNLFKTKIETAINSKINVLACTALETVVNKNVTSVLQRFDAALTPMEKPPARTPLAFEPAHRRESVSL